jgi:phage terminase large subunit
MESLELTQKQALAWIEILDDPGKRRILFDGGARCGKTVLICAWLLYQADRYPGARILLARLHRNAAEKSLFDETLRGLVRGRREFAVREGDLEIRHRNGSTLFVDGLDDADRVDKVLGREFSHIFFNEATQISYATTQVLLSRLAQAVVPVRKAIFDCNPKGTRNWLYLAGIKGQDPEGRELPDRGTWARLSWTPYDNPYLPADTLSTLESLTGTQRRRMLDGVWCDTQGQVYDDFDEAVHVAEALPPGAESWPRVCSVDFGFTNPFVCLWGAIDPDGRLWIYRERYVRRMICRDHAVAILAASRGDPGLPRWTVADHDAEDRATLAAGGIETDRADKRVLPGIGAVQARLRPAGDGRPRLFVLRSCRNMIGEFLDYAWAETQAAGRGKDEPIKENDHAMDALRYMVARLDLGTGAWGPSGKC